MFEKIPIVLSTLCTKKLKVEPAREGCHHYNEQLYTGTKHAQTRDKGYEHVTITSPNIVMEATLDAPQDPKVAGWLVGFVQNLTREQLLIEYDSVTLKVRTGGLPALDIMLGYNAPYDEGDAIGMHLEPGKRVLTRTQREPYLDDAPGCSILTTDPNSGKKLAIRSFSRLMAFRVYVAAKEVKTGDIELLRRIDWNLYYRLEFDTIVGQKVKLNSFVPGAQVDFGYVVAEALRGPDGTEGVAWGGIRKNVTGDQPVLDGGHRTTLETVCPMAVSVLPGAGETHGTTRLNVSKLPTLGGGFIFDF
jgi:hypothetical protein